MSIPITVILHKLLHGPASRWPGRRGFEDDVGKNHKNSKNGENGEEGANEQHRENLKRALHAIETGERLRNENRESAFGEAIKQGIVRGNAADMSTVSEMANIAYGGIDNYCFLLSHVIFTLLSRYYHVIITLLSRHYHVIITLLSRYYHVIIMLLSQHNADRFNRLFLPNLYCFLYKLFFRYFLFCFHIVTNRF